MRLKELLDPGKYIGLLRRMARGLVPVPDVDDWLEWVGGDAGRLEKILVTIGKKLLERHRSVIYPVEMIVVPRYPFTKQPMIQWGILRTGGYGDYDVNTVKDITGRLGTLVNAAFIGRNFVLVDIDTEEIPSEIEVDVATRRGYHKIFYIKDYPAIEFKIGGNPSTKTKLNCNGVDIEILSGSLYLISHPLQSRYLEYANGKFNVRRYKFTSKTAEIAFRSADITPIQARVEDVKDYITTLLKALGCENTANRLELRGLDKEEYLSELPEVKAKESRFNREALSTVGTLTYQELKALLETRATRLPVCIKEAMFGTIEKGHRWYHLRLLLAVLPHLVYIDKDTLDALVSDFAHRTGSTRGDIRKWLYDSKYFTGKMTIDGQEVLVPSRLGVPHEAWSDFEALGYCEKCPLREQCKNRTGAARRRVIVRYLTELAGDVA